MKQYINFIIALIIFSTICFSGNVFAVKVDFLQNNSQHLLQPPAGIPIVAPNAGFILQPTQGEKVSAVKIAQQNVASPKNATSLSGNNKIGLFVFLLILALVLFFWFIKSKR